MQTRSDNPAAQPRTRKPQTTRPAAATVAINSSAPSAPSGPSALETAGQQAAKARHAGWVVLAELNHAHRLIALLLRELSPAGMARFAEASGDDGIGTDGAIRHHERAAALALAHSSTLAQPGAQHG